MQRIVGLGLPRHSFPRRETTTALDLFTGNTRVLVRAEYIMDGSLHTHLSCFQVGVSRRTRLPDARVGIVGSDKRGRYLRRVLFTDGYDLRMGTIYRWVRFTDGYDLRMGTIYGWVLFTDGCYLRMDAPVSILI